MRRAEITAEIRRCRNELASLTRSLGSFATADIGTIEDTLNQRLRGKGYHRGPGANGEEAWYTASNTLVATVHSSADETYLTLYHPDKSETTMIVSTDAADSVDLSI